MPINQLPAITAITGAESVPMSSTSLGTDVRATWATVLDYLLKQTTSTGALFTQYAAPAATGFNIVIAPVITGQNIWLLLTPNAAFATGTITLPGINEAVDKQEFSMSITQALAAVTFLAAGAAVNGAPGGFSAGGSCKFRFDGIFKQWYRVS